MNPPFNSDSAQQIVDKFTDPSHFPWPAIASPGNGEVSTQTNLVGGSFPFLGDQGLIPTFGFFYMGLDMACDATAYKNYKITSIPESLPPDEVDTFLCKTSCFVSLAWQMLTANYSLMQSGPQTVADRMTLAYWGLGFLPMGINWIFTFGAPNKRIADINAAYGVPLICASGLLLLALGVATSVTQIVNKTDPNKAYNGFYWAQNVVAPLPTVFKPLLTVPGDMAKEIASTILIGLDMDCDAASCALAFCQDWL